MILKFPTMAALASAAICFSGAAFLSGCATLDQLEQNSVEQVGSLDDATLCRHYLSMYDDVPTRYGNAVESEMVKRKMDDAACREHAPSPVAGAIAAGALMAVADKHPKRVKVDEENEVHWTWRYETSPVRGPRWACRGEMHHELAPDYRCGQRPNEVAVQK